jgi:hypothetical protein
VGDLSRRSLEPSGGIADLFHTMAAANKAGKAALKQLLGKLNA